MQILNLDYSLYVNESTLISLRVDVGFILALMRNYLISLSAVFGEPVFSDDWARCDDEFLQEIDLRCDIQDHSPTGGNQTSAFNSGQENWLKSSPSSDGIQNTTMSALYFHQETDPDYPQLKWHWKSRDIPYKSHHITSHEKSTEETDQVMS